jgi:ketosteroid isomerase-like protein
MHKRLLATLIAVAAVVTLGVNDPGRATAITPAGESGRDETSHRSTLQDTRALLSALERKDLQAISALTDQRATLTNTLPLSGIREAAVTLEGKEQILGYIQQVFTTMGAIAFSDVLVTVSADGRTSFVQANGDFTTADGRPYRNVYMFRYDWRDSRVVNTLEYANPVTFCKTFGHPDC